MSFLGCNANNTFLFSREKKEKDFENYLENKYDKEFEFKCMESENTYSLFNTSTREIASFYPKDGDKEKDSFKVRRYKDNDGYVYEDRYYLKLINDDYENRVKSVLDKQFSEYKISIIFENNYFNEDVDESESLEDAIEDNVDLFSSITVLVAPTCSDEEFKKKTENISIEIASLKLPMSLSIFYSSTGNLDDIDTNDLHAKMQRTMIVSRDFEVSMYDVLYN